MKIEYLLTTATAPCIGHRGDGHLDVGVDIFMYYSARILGKRRVVARDRHLDALLEYVCPSRAM